jgi:WD40 repeat protein
MRKKLLLLSGLMATLVLLAGCGAPAGAGATQLAFEAQMNVDSGQRFHVSLGARNVGEARFRDYQAFNGVMKLRDDTGGNCGSISVATLWDLAPGNAGWPAAYASQLPAGAYQLTWGAPDYGSVTVDFTIVEFDGWLYLGKELIQSTAGETPEGEREYGPLQSLVDLARVNLAQRLGVEAEAVAVQSIEEAEFPDASLGVPEPGQMYAQVITPGYAIKLATEGQVYEYRASDERLVLVSREGQAPEDQTPSEAGEAPAGHVEPPPAILEIAGREQVSGIGAYCWQETAGTDASVGLCADMVGIPTVEEPLVVSSPFTATFRLAPEETPDELLLEVIPVTAKDEFEEWPIGGRGWAFKEGELYSLPLEREPSIELSLEPGLYILSIAGWWQAWGDASYGFLVQATGEQHILFSYHRDGATEVWTIDPADGVVERQIRPDQAILNPAHSPSGDTVAYVRMTGDYGGVVSELWLMDRDGSNPRTLYVPPAGQSVLPRPAWQPDGQAIYVLRLGSETASQLLRIPAHGGRPTLVLTDCIDFALSPDGEWLASVNLDRQLTVWARDGSMLADLEPQDSNLTDFDSLAVSPSGDLLAFRATDGDTWNLYVMDLDSLDVRQLTDLGGFHGLDPSGGQVNGLAWTAEGAHLVYSVDGYPEQTGIWLVGVEEGKPQRLFAWEEGEWATVQGPWFEPSAQFPALTVDEHAIVAAEVDGPGHFEYTDRLGADLQARIEGLRAFAAGQALARTNAALAPFGYRLEARFDAEWTRTFHDLYHNSQAEPVLPGLSNVWPVSVNASGTGFILAAENAPNVFPLYLLVQAGSVEPWDADQNAFLPPAYVGDDLASVTFTGFPTLTFQVELNEQAVYSGTAVAQGAYMPLRSFTAWDGHWVLEADDHLIMDGQDLGETLDYEAAFGFSLIQGQPFYFFEQEDKVRMSYGGRTLPFVYDQVFHNQCCERAIHNVETLGDVVLFHALWNGTWHLVEAGVYDGEMTGTYRYTAPEGWSFRYPMHWDRFDEELGTGMGGRSWGRGSASGSGEGSGTRGRRDLRD